MKGQPYYWCELEVAKLLNRQERHGVRFDKKKASFLVYVLTEEILKVDAEAIPQLPLMMHKADAYARPFLKSGKLAKWPALYCDTHGIPHDKVGGPFSRVWFTPFDMSKTDKIKRILIDHGWIPDEWNTKNLKDFDNDFDRDQWIDNYISKNFVEESSKHWKEVLLKALNFKGRRNRVALANFLSEKRFIETSPKITEDSLHTVDGTVGTLVKRRVMLSHRRSLIVGLLSKLRDDSKLEAGCNPCATPTFRANYRVVVNIPAARSDYGKEIRSLFLPDNVGYSPCLLDAKPVEGTRVPHTNIILDPKGGRHPRKLLSLYDHVLVGSDASGLEARMLCHYMDDMEYTDMLLNGDIHSYNQQLAGLPTRDDAKTFFYALLYGAGDTKLGNIVGGGLSAGRQIRAEFMDKLPKYAALVKRLEKEAEGGYIEGLDGRPIRLRRDSEGKVQTHKVLNTLLQSAGAIVMKYGMIFLDHWVTSDQLEAWQVLWQHDETQWSCHKKDLEKFVHYANNYVRVAGEYLKMNIPLASDAIVGANWYDTH